MRGWNRTRQSNRREADSLPYDPDTRFSAAPGIADVLPRRRREPCLYGSVVPAAKHGRVAKSVHKKNEVRSPKRVS